MEGRSLAGLLQVLPRFSNSQLTDPLLIAYLKALVLVSTTEKCLPTATVLEHVVTSCSVKLTSPIISSSRASTDKVIENVKALSENLAVLLERYQAALHVGAELQNGPKCLVTLWRDSIKMVVSTIKEQPAVWVRTHQLLETAASCCEMSNYFAKTLPDQPSTAGAVKCTHMLKPLLEAEMESACQTFTSLVDELCKNDEQRLVAFYNHDSAPVQLLLGSGWLADVLNVTLRVHSTGLSLPNLLHSMLLGIQTYSGRIMQTASKVPRSAPIMSWYLIINSLDHLCMRLSELHTRHQSMVELGQVCRWVEQQCEAVVERTISYHQQLCSISLLHDNDSYDWQRTRPFCEGERVSYTVQAWHLHMKALLCDLTNHTPCDYITRITSSVLLHSLTAMADYYPHLQPASARMKQYRGDIAAILAIVGSLLPHLFSLNDPSPEFCLINKKCCLLAQALSSAKGVTHWQQFVDWDRIGLAPSSKVSSLVLFPDAQWGLLVELLLEKDHQLAVTLCHQGLLPVCASVLCHCHHSPGALANVLTRDGSNHTEALSWMREMVGKVLLRPVLDTAVQFTVAMIHHVAHGSSDSDLTILVTPLLTELLSRLYTTMQRQLDQPILALLASGLLKERSSSQLLGDILSAAVSLPDWLSERVDPSVSQWWNVFYRLLNALFGEGRLSDYPVLYQCIQSDGVQKKLTELFSVMSSDSVDHAEVWSDDVMTVLHSTAAEVILSDEQGGQAMKTILHWITTNKDALLSQKDDLTSVSPVESKKLGFDPVKTCCTLGNSVFDHQYFISLQ